MTPADIQTLDPSTLYRSASKISAFGHKSSMKSPTASKMIADGFKVKAHHKITFNNYTSANKTTISESKI